MDAFAQVAGTPLGGSTGPLDMSVYGLFMQADWVVKAVMIALLSAFGAAAQGPGPQGEGSAKEAHSSDASRSYNPIKWIKKGPNTTTEKLKKAKNKKPSEKSETPDTAAQPPKP